MTYLHATFRTLARVDLALDRLLEIANRLFFESTGSGQFATLICGRANAAGEIEIASAGHLPALLVSRGGVKEIASTGLPLGIFSTSDYSVERIRLEPGDSLMLFTDGLSEACDPSGQEYGISGLALSAAGRHGWAAEELVSACRRDVERYSRAARRADDQTLLMIHLAQSDAVAFPGR
jgi:sigma-B regulation protein RsbU (phosphoserine phosphatase)